MLSKAQIDLVHRQLIARDDTLSMDVRSYLEHVSKLGVEYACTKPDKTRELREVYLFKSSPFHGSSRRLYLCMNGVGDTKEYSQNANEVEFFFGQKSGNNLRDSLAANIFGLTMAGIGYGIYDEYLGQFDDKSEMHYAPQRTSRLEDPKRSADWVNPLRFGIDDLATMLEHTDFMIGFFNAIDGMATAQFNGLVKTLKQLKVPRFPGQQRKGEEAFLLPYLK